MDKMEVNWAGEMGINLEDLKLESPNHPRQVGIGIRHRIKAREYWEWKRSGVVSEIRGQSKRGTKALQVGGTNGIN